MGKIINCGGGVTIFREELTHQIEYFEEIVCKSEILIANTLRSMGVPYKYEKNGFWPGDRLIFTMESATKSLDTRLLKALIQRNLID